MIALTPMNIINFFFDYVNGKYFFWDCYIFSDESKNMLMSHEVGLEFGRDVIELLVRPQNLLRGIDLSLS